MFKNYLFSNKKELKDKIYESFNKVEVRYEWFETGQKKSEEWLLNGELHREDGPGYQEWYDTGQKWVEEWVLNGKYHREDGPSYQSFYESGQKKVNIWYLNGKQHREDGPSYEFWYDNGLNKVESWYLNDKEYYSLEEWIDNLKDIGSPHYEYQLAIYNIEKYNI